MRTDILIAVFGVSFASFAAGSYILSSLKRDRADTLTSQILAGLPAWDCGLCGLQDCKSFARALASGDGDHRCVPGGPAVERRIAGALGRPPYRKKNSKAVAVVACAGDDRSVKPVFEYAGYRDCAAAAGLYGGPRACGTGCLGYGTCVPACPRDAIAVKNGLAVIRPDLCDGCGACVSACPTGVIRMLPRRDAWFVACSSTAPGKVKESSCTASCTACGICQRRSAGGEFSLKNNLAAASATLAGDWAAIAADCPTGVIRTIGSEKKPAGSFESKDGGL